MSYAHSWQHTALGTLVLRSFRVVHRVGVWRVYRIDEAGVAVFKVCLESEEAARIYCEIELSLEPDPK